jgi:RNA-directed DNA polymerase
LAFNEEKTRIVHLGQDGFDFLGFNVRRYQGGKLLIKPSTAAVRRLRERLSVEMRGLRGSNAMAVIARLNPTIRGWAAYYRGVVSSKTFHALDYHVWKLTYKWAKHTHPNKSKWWTCGRYFGRFNKFRNDRWVFGARDRISWTDIVRHQMVAGRASPDDPDLTSYWTARRRRVKPPLDNYTLRLLDRQRGCCPLCTDPLLTADQPPQSPREWERWWLTVTRKAIAHDYLVHDGRPGQRGGPDGDRTRLVHASCRRQVGKGGKPIASSPHAPVAA